VNLRDLAPLAFFREIAKPKNKYARRARLLRELCKLFVIEARDRPIDREYLMTCARDIYRRMKRAEEKA
jgi:hypothetical protein